MYIEPTRSYYAGTEQRAARGRFLLLVQDKDKPIGPDNFRALVRKVALRQFGHWMMGKARVGGESLTVSGSYGSDGLPMNVSANVFNRSVPVPKALYDAWNKGEGWNSAGNEALSMRQWALDTFA